MRTGRSGALWGLLGIVCFGCGGRVGNSAAEAAVKSDHPREATFSETTANFDEYEGPLHRNDCSTDDDCYVSGCYQSTCAAETVSMLITNATFCTARGSSSWPEPHMSKCGCVERTCRWYFETDYDRPCNANKDCDGLGPPPEGIQKKAIWTCVEGRCRF